MLPAVPPAEWEATVNLGLEIFLFLFIPSLFSAAVFNKLFEHFAVCLTPRYREGEFAGLLLLEAILASILAVLAVHFLFSPWSFFVFKIMYLAHGCSHVYTHLQRQIENLMQ